MLVSSIIPVPELWRMVINQSIIYFLTLKHNKEEDNWGWCKSNCLNRGTVPKHKHDKVQTAGIKQVKQSNKSVKQMHGAELIIRSSSRHSRRLPNRQRPNYVILEECRKLPVTI